MKQKTEEFNLLFVNVRLNLVNKISTGKKYAIVRNRNSILNPVESNELLL